MKRVVCPLDAYRTSKSRREAIDAGFSAAIRSGGKQFGHDMATGSGIVAADNVQVGNAAAIR